MKAIIIQDPSYVLRIIITDKDKKSCEYAWTSIKWAQKLCEFGIINATITPYLEDHLYILTFKDKQVLKVLKEPYLLVLHKILSSPPTRFKQLLSLADNYWLMEFLANIAIKFGKDEIKRMFNVKTYDPFENNKTSIVLYKSYSLICAPYLNKFDGEIIHYTFLYNLLTELRPSKRKVSNCINKDTKLVKRYEKLYIELQRFDLSEAGKQMKDAIEQIVIGNMLL